MKPLVKYACMLLLAVSVAAGGRFIDAWAADKPIDTISDVPRTVRLALFSCQEHVDKGEFTEGADGLLDFLKRHPEDDHFYVQYYLGSCLAQSGRATEALDHYRAAVELEPRFTQGWLNLGELAYNLGRYGIAAEAIHEGYTLSPEKRPQLIYYAALAYLMDKQTQKAAQLLEQLVSDDAATPKLEYYRAFISACVDLRDASRGQRAVSRMLTHFPDNPEAWLLSFQYAASMEDYLHAAVALTITGYLRPLTREEQVQLGDIYSLINVPAQASVYYDAAVSDTASSRDFERLASAYIAAYDTERALETLKRALAHNSSFRLWSLLGDLYYMEKTYDKAYDAFKHCTELNKEQGRPYLMMGYCALELGRIREAMVHLGIAETFPEQQEMARLLIKQAEKEKQKNQF